jgi:putative addiction module component (TIGR02574 family)
VVFVVEAARLARRGEQRQRWSRSAGPLRCGTPLDGLASPAHPAPVMGEPALLQVVLSLPKDERAELALRLVESLDSASDGDDVEAAWAAEVVERVEALHAGRAVTVSLVDAIASARAHLRRADG